MQTIWELNQNLNAVHTVNVDNVLTNLNVLKLIDVYARDDAVNWRFQLRK